MIHACRGTVPGIHRSVFVAPGAQIIGDVKIDEHSSVWYNAVIRADINYIRIGRNTNVQDGCILHVRHEYPLEIGSNITIGHGAILHACRIEDCCLIGMGAIVLDNARIKPYTLIAAGTVVKNNDEFPEGVLIAGVPGKIVRQLSSEERAMLEESAKQYVGYVQLYRETT